MLEHLVHEKWDLTPPTAVKRLDDATPAELLAAQSKTSDWLEEIGAPDDEEIDARLQVQKAREAFKAVVTSAAPTEQKAALIALKTPPAVQHLVGMLTAYDWQFIEQAKELRGYAVAQILDETKHPDARIRLKALQMLGNVTEVGLFTTRVEVTSKDADPDEIERRVREKLEKFLKPTLIEAEPIPVAEPAPFSEIDDEIAQAQKPDDE